MEYSFVVETLNEKESKYVSIGRKEYLIAKKDSRYVIKILNRSKTHCNVSIYIRDKFMGSWKLNPDTVVTIKKEFIFSDHWHINEDDDKNLEDTCEESTITARFSSESSKNSENIYTLSLPVIICNHDLS